MDAIRTDNYGGVSKLLETMKTSTEMLEALSTMIGYTLFSGDDNNNISYGVESLIRQQCEDLNFINDALKDQFNAIRKEKLVVRDIQQIAASTGIPVEIVETCVTMATGCRFRNQSKPIAEHPNG